MKEDPEEDVQEDDFTNDEPWKNNRTSSWQNEKNHQDSAGDFYRNSRYETKRSGDHQQYRVDERNINEDNYP